MIYDVKNFYQKFSQKILRFILLPGHFTKDVLAIFRGVTPLTIVNIDSTTPIAPPHSSSDRALGTPLPSNFHFGGFLDHFWENVRPKKFHFAEKRVMKKPTETKKKYTTL